VRLVQQAKVPPIRTINPRVSPGLETVLSRALSGDPAQRYQSARDLGRDLNKILFHLGREVSSFDIAQLVLPIWRERHEKRRPTPGSDRGSFIGSLIDEALFEFTSLEAGERKSQLSNSGATPLIGGYENVQNWAMALGQERSGPVSGDGNFEVGNLASLEDDPLSGSGPASRRPDPDPELPLRPLSSSLPMPADTEVEEMNLRRGKGPLYGAIAAAVVLVLLLAAYFGGVFGR
jgi:hypothetical protein